MLRLRKISNEVFQLLFKLRRPSDPLGTRFNTICHGDMWMGNLMFRKDKETGNTEECFMIDFHSAQFLSPATDLAHLLLTSTTRDYRKEVLFSISSLLAVSLPSISCLFTFQAFCLL